MPGFAEVTHREWIAAPPEQVRAQFADLQHHIRTNVHPKLKFEVLQQGPQRTRFKQEVRLLGIRQRDVFVREFEPDGTMVDTAIEGFNKGGTIVIGFAPEARSGSEGTRVGITVRLPLPPLVGMLVRPLLERQIRKKVAAAAAEDKYDLEVRGYDAPALRRAA